MTRTQIIADIEREPAPEGLEVVRKAAIRRIEAMNDNQFADYATRYRPRATAAR